MSSRRLISLVTLLVLVLLATLHVSTAQVPPIPNDGEGRDPEKGEPPIGDDDDDGTEAPCSEDSTHFYGADGDSSGSGSSDESQTHPGGHRGPRPAGGGGVRPNDDFDMDDCMEYEGTLEPSAAPVGTANGSPNTEIDELQTFFCEVSIALPNYSRVRRELSNIHSYEDYLMIVTIVMDGVVDGDEEFTLLKHRLLGKKKRKKADPDDVTILIQSREHSSMRRLDLDGTDNAVAEWWLSTIAYETFATQTEADIIEEKLMEVVSESVESGIFLERVWMKAPEVLNVTKVGDEHYIGPVDNLVDEQEVEPLDVSVWDVRRWVGLGMFTFTLLFTLLVSTTAHRRRKIQDEQEHWGLNSDRGVDDLLNYAWDGKMVYNKGKLGYNDDDSMLIGGYQQGATNTLASTDPPTSSATGTGTAPGTGTGTESLEASNVGS